MVLRVVISYNESLYNDYGAYSTICLLICIHDNKIWDQKGAGNELAGNKLGSYVHLH